MIRRKRKSRRVGTDGSLLPSLPWTLAALVFAIAPHVQFIPVWITLAFLICAATRWIIERRRWRLPPAWLRVVLALTCFLGVIASYDGSFSGVGPGSALLAVMAALKLLETRQRRDQFVLLFLAIFLIMSSLLREQYLWSLPYLVVGVVMVMTAWLRMSVTRPTSLRRSFATGARLIAYSAPIALAMWVFFPRIATPFWAVPIDTSSATSGLSDQMSPGDISSLSLSDAVAFRVNFEGAAPPPQDRYWRGLVLTSFNGRTWTGFEPTMGRDNDQDIEYLGDPVHYQITMEPTRQQWVFALDIPKEWPFREAKIFMSRQQQLARMQPIDQRIAYELVSHPRFRLGANLGAFWRERYTRMPTSSNRRAIELARDMRRRNHSEEAFVESVLRMFNEEEFFYTLEPPPLGASPVDEFLFETRQGFCEHYASAFAVMMRSVGIPSRIVLGYQGGEVNPLSGRMIVRQSDAHAWTEIWLPSRGWLRVDPTAAVAPERIDLGMSGAMFDGIGASWGLNAPSRLLHQITLTWDMLNAQWNEFVLGYGPENQQSFMEWLGMDDPDWRKMMLTLIAIVAALVLAISMLLVMRYRPPPKDRAAILYRRFMRKAGVQPITGETPRAYAARLAEQLSDIADDAADVTDKYLAARYGPPDVRALDGLQAAVSRFSVPA